MALEVTTKKGRRALAYDGYVYRNISKKQSIGLYRWRCTVKTCRGRIVTSSDCLDIRIIGEHNHAPPRRLRLSQYPGEFISVDKTNEGVNDSIIKQEDALQIPILSKEDSAQMSLKEEPALFYDDSKESTSAAVSVQFQSESCGTLLIPTAYHYTQDGRQFLLHSAEDASFALFGTIDNLTTLFASRHVRIDVTNRLVVFHRVFYRRLVPLVFCCLARCTQFHYDAVVTTLLQLGVTHGLEMQWTQVTWTPERNFLPALQSMLVGSDHIVCGGCPGHYIARLKDKITELGLLEDYKVCPELATGLRMCSALVLLPQRDVPRGWLDLCQWILCEAPARCLPQLQILANYIRQEWVDNPNMPVHYWNGAHTGLSLLPAVWLWTYRLETQLSLTSHPSNLANSSSQIVDNLCKFFITEQIQTDSDMALFETGDLGRDVDEFFEARNSVAVQAIRESFDNCETDRLTFLKNVADVLENFV